MAIVQALLTFLSRSVGKVVNAIFGWAVVALFGQTTPGEKTVLSGLVGLAAAWPLLLLGVAFPKLATLVLAFVPMSEQGPRWLVRVIWLALAVVVPITVGLVVAAKAPPGAPAEPFWKTTLRGFPITLALAGAFLLTAATVPVLRLADALRRRKNEHVPLVTTAAVYDRISEQLEALLDRQGVQLERQEPPWWQSAPTRLLTRLGGRAFRGFVPERLAYWSGPELSAALYPNDLLLRGARRTTAWVHGLVVEEMTRSPALQTFDPEGQAIEREIRRVWHVYSENPRAHREAAALLSRVRQIAGELRTVDLPYDEWATLYRQCVQLERALEGKPQLLSQETEERAVAAKQHRHPPVTDGRRGWLRALFAPT